MLLSFWYRWVSSELSWVWEGDHDDDATKRWQEALARLIPSSQQRVSCDDDDIVPAHVKQAESWDCGIACLLMTLQWLHDKEVDVDSERLWMLKTVSTESIWSIDLVNLLEIYRSQKLQFTYLFCSSTLTVEQAYKDWSFYQTAFTSDQVRVTRLFEQAQYQNWNLLKVDLSVNQVFELVQRHDCIAIALVDHAILLQRSPWTQYSGHFILLSGVRCSDGHLRIHNPTSSFDTDFICPSLFEKAWTAKGTDKDIIFLVKQLEH